MHIYQKIGGTLLLLYFVHCYHYMLLNAVKIFHLSDHALVAFYLSYLGPLAMY